MPKISKQFVESLPPADRQTDYMDDEIRGFGLRVYAPNVRYPKGRRVFFIRTYPRGSGRECRTTIGDYGLITIDGARRQARSLLALADTGAMPTREMKAQLDDLQHKEMSLAELVRLYEEQHLIPHCTPSTRRTARSLIKTHLLPRLGDLSIEQISKADVLHHHAEVGKSSKVQANRMVTLLSAILSWGTGHEYRYSIDNPCRKDPRGHAGIRKFEEQKRERFLTPEDVARLEDVLSRAEHTRGSTKGHVNAGTCDMIRMLLYTGARFGELSRLTWSMVDFENHALRVYVTKEKKPKFVLLNEHALVVITRHAARSGFLPERKNGARGGDQVFHAKNITRAWAQTIRPAAGLDARDGKPAFRLHDFRHSFVSAGVNAGLSLKDVGETVGHGDILSTNRYAHYAMARLKGVVQQIGRSLTGKDDPVES